VLAIKKSFILVFLHLILKQHVNIALQHALAFTIKKKIALASDACSKPPIIIRSHNLHEGNIRGAVGDIASYQEPTSSLPLSWFLPVVSLLAFLWPSFFCLLFDGSSHQSFIGFLCSGSLHFTNISNICVNIDNPLIFDTSLPLIHIPLLRFFGFR
jgi:hypothetical protein